MTSPLDDIENRRAQQDFGVFAYRIWQGARGEGASVFEAFMIVAAWVRGTIGANDDKEPNDGE